MDTLQTTTTTDNKLVYYCLIIAESYVSFNTCLVFLRTFVFINLLVNVFHELKPVGNFLGFWLLLVVVPYAMQRLQNRASFFSQYESHNLRKRPPESSGRKYPFVALNFVVSGWCGWNSKYSVSLSRFGFTNYQWYAATEGITDWSRWIFETCVRGAEHTSGWGCLVLVYQYIQSGLCFLILAE